MQTLRLLITSLLVSTALACGHDSDDSFVSGETKGDTNDETGSGDGDGDGLTDEQEAEHGTDPTKVDTDGDTYWDSWELGEDTDPLDYESRIYAGFWPYNPDKAGLDPGDWATANTAVGTPIPRDSFVDQHGEMVDIHDFGEYINADNRSTYVVFDLSAQWCGPCHIVADWLAGTYASAVEHLDPIYPTVREKVESRRIWWLTFIVEDNDGGPPTFADASAWYELHGDDRIPILVDRDGLIHSHYQGAGFPHFFLADPQMRVKYYPIAGDKTDTNPYPALGVVDLYL